jgi:hypothetical protein
MAVKLKDVVDEIAMAQAENLFARADALAHGAIHILQGTDFNVWGPEIAADVAISLLQESLICREDARAAHNRACSIGKGKSR